MKKTLVEILEQTRSPKTLLDDEMLLRDEILIEELKEVLFEEVEKDDFQVYQHSWIVELENEKILQLINHGKKPVNGESHEVCLVVRIHLTPEVSSILIRENLQSLLS